MTSDLADRPSPPNKSSLVRPCSPMTAQPYRPYRRSCRTATSPDQHTRSLAAHHHRPHRERTDRTGRHRHAPSATGELTQVGRRTYLHDLLASGPTGATAGHYAKLVADAAARRRASEAATRIAQAAPNRHRPGRCRPSRQADLVADSGQVWPDPIPLTTGHELPGYPSMVLPDGWVKWSRPPLQLRRRPADLAGSVVLACLSAATMGPHHRRNRSPVGSNKPACVTCTALGQ